MKSQILNRLISLVLSVCAGVFCVSAAGQSKLFIQNFTVHGSTPTTVEIILDNPNPVLAYNFTIEMPDGLKIVDGSVQKTTRFNEGQTLGFRNNVFAVVSMQDKPFFNEYGAVGTFQVESTAPITEDRDVEIKLKNITIVGQNFNDNVSIPELTTTVTLAAKEDPVKLSMTLLPESPVANPGGVLDVSVAMSNNADLQGMQMVLILPEGFSLVNSGSGVFEQTSRLGGGATIQYTTKGNVTNIIIADILANNALAAGEGEFMNFKVQVPENFTAGTADIEFTNIQASVNFKTKKAAPVTMEVTNGLIAYNNAKSEIAKLEESLNNALETITSECPDVKDLFPGDEIANQIESLKSDVDMAYQELTLTDNYAQVMAPAKEIEAAIKSLVESAKAAQKANDDEVAAELARQEAYKNAKALLESLSSSLDSALVTIEEKYPDVKDYFTGEEIAASIISMQNAVDAAYEDKTLVANYEQLTAPATDIQNAIAQLIDDAKNAQAEFENNAAAEAARLEAYKNANAVVEGLTNSLKEALAIIDGACPDVKDSFKGNDIAASINDMQSAIEAALKDKTIVEKYDELVAPEATIKEAIAKLIEDAKAAQKAYEENAALETARLKANAALAELDKALADALVEIESACPDVKHLYNGASIQQQIAVLRNAVNTAYENKTLAEKYDEVMAPEATIKEAIVKLIEDAKAAQKAVEDGESARQLAYKNAKALLETLSTSLDNALVTIGEKYPDVKDYFTGEEIAASIISMQNAIDAAYENKTLVANYEQLTAPATDIQNAIAQLIDDAKNAQAEFEKNAAAETARLEAYKNANAVVEGLTNSLKEALAIIDGACPDVKDSFQGNDIAASIKDMQSAIEAALKDKTIVEKYDELVAPEATIKEAIAKLIEDAKASQKAYEENAALETARLKANAALAELDKALADALVEIESACPDVKHLYNGASIQQQITVLRNAVNTAYENKTLAEKYDEVMAPEATIKEAIAKLIEDAKAAQKAIDEAETARQKYNAEAYETALAAIADLQNKLDAAKIEIEEKYPEFDYTDWYNKISAAINILKDKADKENERVADEGKYSYIVDPIQVEEMIEKMLIEARASGIDAIIGDQLKEYRIFTMEGIEVPELQHGEVNIILKADGTRVKVFVK